MIQALWFCVAWISLISEVCYGNTFWCWLVHARFWTTSKSIPLGFVYYFMLWITICDRLQENRAQRGTIHFKEKLRTPRCAQFSCRRSYLLLFSALTLMFVRSFIWLQTENKMGGLKYYLAMGTNLRKRRSSADGSTWSFKQILRQQGRVAIIFLIEWSNTSQQMRLWLLPYKAGHNFDSVQKDSIQDNWISWYSTNQMRKRLMKSFC